MLRAFVIVMSLLFLGAAGAVGAAFYGFYHYGRGLPDYRQLAEYEPPVMTRLYAGTGQLITEYATEKRVFVPIEAIPRRTINAFLSAEDKTFFEHPGLDFQGLARAMLVNIKNYGSDRRPIGASTITQQVAKNFLLTNEVSIERKVKEAILAFRIEQAYTKNHILELYLNEIYLGFGSYGVAAAAMNYFNKSLDELTIAETAFLAALPKGPNNYHPIRKHAAALERRDWVIDRMTQDGHITPVEAELARDEPLEVRSRSETEFVKGADHFAEDVRRMLEARYGSDALYQGGLAVRTTLDPQMQHKARTAVQDGLIAYDRRHGWRGPIAPMPTTPGWQARLERFDPPPGLLDEWRMAVVLNVTPGQAVIGLMDGTEGSIPFEEVRWARDWLEGQTLGPEVTSTLEVLSAGDVIAVERLEGDAPMFGLRQIPEIEGALVALDPHTGRVLAMVGGYAFGGSQFNRATQAKRQPGSAFKPFVYLTALENGYTPASVILDAPFVIDQGPNLPKWKPRNYGNRFYGPSTLRVGIEKSRNLMTVRLAEAVGMDKIVQTAKDFGIVDRLQPHLSMALGAGETRLIDITAAYGMLVNGGKRIQPTLVDRIQDRHGVTVFRHDDRPCETCRADFWTNQDMPDLPDTRKQIADPASAYQMVSILEGVVLRGTGRRIAELGRPIAGKTGTTNDSQDTWFVGFTPDLAVGVFVGFDEPRTLGKRETGSSAAAPIFKDFMGAALAEKPPVPFRIPPEIRLVRIDHDTGRPAGPGDGAVILEAFKPGTEPAEDQRVVGGGESQNFSSESTDQVPEAGGLY